MKKIEKLKKVIIALEKRQLDRDIEFQYFLEDDEMYQVFGKGTKSYHIFGYPIVFFLIYDLKEDKVFFKVEGDTSQLIYDLKSILAEEERKVISAGVINNEESVKRKRI